ncbi:MAG TPA: ABC transporter ATP-binding protein, partial [Thermomonas sp.]
MTDSATDIPDPSKPKAKLGTLRALWPFVRQHAGLFAAWLCALALASAATLSFPVAFKQMIDGGFHS